MLTWRLDVDWSRGTRATDDEKSESINFESCESSWQSLMSLAFYFRSFSFRLQKYRQCVSQSSLSLLLFIAFSQVSQDARARKFSLSLIELKPCRHKRLKKAKMGKESRRRWRRKEERCERKEKKWRKKKDRSKFYSLFGLASLNPEETEANRPTDRAIKMAFFW